MQLKREKFSYGSKMSRKEKLYLAMKLIESAMEGT